MLTFSQINQLISHKSMISLPIKIEFLDTFTGNLPTLFQPLAGSAIMAGQPTSVVKVRGLFVAYSPSRVKSGNCPSTMAVFVLPLVGCKAVVAFCVTAITSLVTKK
jgi:hypothetical protein